MSRFTHLGGGAARAILGVLLLLLPGAASAQGRPSLVDLDATLDQVVNGLCNGDASSCGTTPVTPVAGQIDFGLFQADFSSLRFAMTKPSGGSAVIEDVSVTVDVAAMTAIVVERLSAGWIFANVTAVVPDPSGPGNTTIFDFFNAVLQSIDVTSDGSRVELVFGVEQATYSWLGASSSFDQLTGAVGGCVVPGGEKHVALAGNDSSLLGPGDIEASFGLMFDTSGGPVTQAFRYARPPTATSACLLRTVGNAVSLVANFDRLSPLSDTFGMQLAEETVDITSSTIATYELVIDGASMDETLMLDLTSGKITSREFNPVDGSLLTDTTFSF